jgi:integrase
VADKWKWAYVALERGEHRRRVLGLPGRPKPLDEMAERYLEARRNTMAPGTWSADRTAIGHLLDAFPGRTHTDIRPEELSAWAESLYQRGYRPNTVHTYLRTLRVFFAALGDWNPAREVKLPPAPEQDVRTLSDDEISRVRGAASIVDSQRVRTFPSCRIAVEVGLSMGLRQGEIFGLRWQDIRPSEKVVRVDRQTIKDRRGTRPLKGRRSRTALVLPGWWDFHERRMGWVLPGRGDQPPGYRTQRNMIVRVLDTAGLNDLGLGWHLLRHTYAARFLRSGGWMQELTRSLGHASIRTTETRYGHLSEDTAASMARGRIYGA